MVGVAQLAEHWTVAPMVGGSSPLTHPFYKSYIFSFYIIAASIVIRHHYTIKIKNLSLVGDYFEILKCFLTTPKHVTHFLSSIFLPVALRTFHDVRTIFLVVGFFVWRAHSM